MTIIYKLDNFAASLTDAKLEHVEFRRTVVCDEQELHEKANVVILINDDFVKNLSSANWSVTPEK